MTEPTPKLSGMYRFTSIARPIDPAYLTNRALLIVLPLLMLLSAGIAALYDIGGGPLSAAISGALVAFAAWALTRELAPDYNAAAFVALALAWIANVALGTTQVLLVFVALLLVRLVNRSTGPQWRVLDTLGVFGFCVWAAVNTQQPLILVVAAAAFTLDATLKDPVRWHYFAAAACVAAFSWLLLGDVRLLASDLAGQDWALIAAFAGGVVLAVAASPEPVSYCDTSPDRLDRVRVNAGLIIGSLAAVQTVLTNGRAAWLETPIWVCMAAVLLAFAARKGNRRAGATRSTTKIE
ncbi:MAG: hypothetical protein EX272_14050 [Chromatiales bacterium]|nr:MAG: hypothetical protein EX272_14050 [Chromatiales bacterium]